MRLLAIVVAVTATLQAASLALAQATPDTSIRVSEAWARATVKTARSAVAYLSVENAGAAGDTLLAASTPVAGHVALHTHISEGGIMRMRPVQSIDIGPRATVRLEPGGLHLMLTELKRPLAEGTRFPLTLRFAKAGEVTVEVAVQRAGAMGMGHGSGHGGGHGH